MNYIYDILLNFKDNFYDFYDWNRNDNIIHIRKIPIYKISQTDLLNIKNNTIKLDYSFLDKIDNKTEIFTNKGIKKIKYACLISDGRFVIGINISLKKLKISSLLIDEEIDTLEQLDNIEEEHIKYLIENKKESNELKTRKQYDVEKFVNQELKKIYNDREKMEYLYYECFNKKEKDLNKIILEFNYLKDEKIVQKLYSFFKLILVHK